MMSSRLAMFAAVAVVSACGHDSMSQSVAAMRGEVAAARDEVARHHDLALATTSMPGMMTELDRHEVTMEGIFGRMDAAMGEMSHCSGGGMMQMRDMMDGMQSAMSAHRAELEADTSLDDARARCASHLAAMDGMLDNMDGALGGMGCM
jgi:hypothetical protein